MLFWNGRPYDVADYSDRAFELKLGVLGLGWTSGHEFGDGPAALEDDYLLSCGLHLIEYGQAPGFEVGRVDCLHMTSIGDQSYRVKSIKAATRGDQRLGPRVVRNGKQGLQPLAESDTTD